VRTLEGYGYRDKEYMKLKIIQGCSSIGVFKPYPYPLHHNPSGLLGFWASAREEVL